MTTTTERILEEVYEKAISGSGQEVNLRSIRDDIARTFQEALEKWTPKTNNTHDNSIYQFIDFFSGCGGMSLGFQAISNEIPLFNSIGGCDIDKDASKSYQENFDVPGIVEDIRSLLNDDDSLASFMTQFPNYDPKKPLIVIGCPPCQGFTTHRKKRWETENDDERNSLVGIFASIAIKLKPVCIVMENVPEMLSEKYWGHFQQAKEIFTREGYIVHQAIYNAASFGVPQERFRTILIAMRHEFLLPTPLISEADKYITVRQAIGKLSAVQPGQADIDDPLHLSARHRASTIKTIQAIPKNGGNRPPGIGPRCLDNVKGFSDVYGRLYWDRPSITITHYARNPASGRYIHPEQDRGLTMREAALLQSFPVGFKFEGSFDSVFKQIGEAVPPRLACGIAASVLVELLASPPSIDELERGIKSVTEPVSSSFSSVIAGLKNSRRYR